MLCVGHCCLDYLTEVANYPEEDDDIRFVRPKVQMLNQSVSSGGRDDL